MIRHPIIRCLIAICVGLGVIPISSVQAQDPDVTTRTESTQESAAFQPDSWSQLIRTAVLAALPGKKVQDRNWGHKSHVLSRYEVKTKGGQLKIRPRTKEVNHGFWQRHTVTMIDPGQNLKIEIRDFKRPAGAPWTFALQVVLRARMNSEFEHWVYGVKGLNGQVDADVTIAADLECSLDLTSIRMDDELLPSVRLIPVIKEIHLKVRDIDARQVGALGGWAAEEIGDGSRSTVNTILHESEGSILQSIRRQIDKQQDRFTISPGELLKLGK